MKRKSRVVRLLYLARDFFSRDLYTKLRHYCAGDVLDVGGWDFYLTAKKRGLEYRTWTTLEYSQKKAFDTREGCHVFLVGDGCRLPLKTGRFDTVLNIQVLEHVLEPVRMVEEVARVLKPGGHAVLLIPQTGSLHGVPRIYYNFTRYWIQEVMECSGLRILELQPLGGVWSATASRLAFFFLQSLRFKGFTSAACERNTWFYLLYPFMVAYALISIPICLLLSLGDLTEEPNNHLVVAQKRESTGLG